MEDFENLTPNNTPTGNRHNPLIDSLDVGLQALASTPTDFPALEVNELPGELLEMGSAIVESSGHTIAHMAEGAGAAAEGLGEAAGAIVEGLGEAAGAIGEFIGGVLGGL